MHDDEQLNDHETLVKSTSSVVGDRMSLKSLMFRCLVDQKIINLVVARKNWLIEIKVCLLFVDFVERKLVWLDSLPCAERLHFRRHAILIFTIFFEEIMLHDSFSELQA
ncbi:hypothetical protein P8452_74426 [Trifolium repens]|nr:hypothetical protein P8452_74426 [Trifolium repens]